MCMCKYTHIYIYIYITIGSDRLSEVVSLDEDVGLRVNPNPQGERARAHALVL